MTVLRKRLLPLVCLTFATLACALINPTPVAWSLTPTPSATPPALIVRPDDAGAAPSIPTATPWPGIITTPTALPGPTASPLPAGAGAALVYLRADQRSLAILRSGQTEPLLVELPAPALALADLQAGLSPDGAWLALRVGAADTSGWALALVNLLDGSLMSVAPLLPDPPGEPAQLVLDGLRAAGGLSWSPQGDYLAFIGAADGPSTDLYVYELAAQRARRLTSGSNLAAAPLWSPDGHWIVHQELRSTDGVTASVTALWAVGIRYGETRRLYTPAKGSQAEHVLGWSAPENLIAYSQTAEGGRAMREIPLHVRWAYPIYSGPFETAALDPISHTLVVAHSQATGALKRLTPGLYRFGAYDRPLEPALVQAGEWRELRWWPQPGLFVATGGLSAVTLDLDGRVTLFQEAAGLAPSPDGRWVVTWGSAGGLGLVQPDGKPMQQVSAETVDALVWLDDSSGILFQAGERLYRADFPLMRPQLIDDAVAAFAW